MFPDVTMSVSVYSQAIGTTVHGDILSSPATAPRILSFSTRSTNECSERKTSGLICQDCFLLARCVRISGIWQTIAVDECNKERGEFCNLASKGCSNATGPCNPLGLVGNFPCTSEGVFPDPYDCQIYHMCYRVGHTNVSVKIECGQDRAFSATTGDCSLSLNDSVCTHTQYQCNHAGEIHAWPGNSNIFYICHATIDQHILYPTMYRCAPSEVFNGSDCVPRGTHGPGGDGGGGVPEQFTCTKSGLFGDSNDCKSYFYCDYSLRWKRYTCELGSHFDNRTKACMRGNCWLLNLERKVKNIFISFYARNRSAVSFGAISDSATKSS